MMTVALVTPYYVPSVRGNAITVERVARGLEGLGVTVSVVDLSRVSRAEALRVMAQADPEIVHAFHAFQAGPPAMEHARRAGVPLVVSLTGTDVNEDLEHPGRARAVRMVLERADRLVVFHESIGAKIAERTAGVAPKTCVIPQSVSLGREPYAFPVEAPVRPGDVRFLVPAGIRRVKNVCFPLEPLGRLAPRFPSLKLLYAGPVLEAEEGARLFSAIAPLPWVFYLGQVPHGEMASLLTQVDVILNSSFSEGGMANSVLEAMAVGRPVLASSIEGNRSLIRDGTDGLLYRTPEEFEAKAEWLLADPALGRRLGEAARLRVMREFSSRREARAYLDLYRGLSRAWRLSRSLSG